MQPDPLFAVRVVTDAKSALSQALPFITSMVGVLAGGFVTYRATVSTERRKFDDETRHLAKSIAAEVEASLVVIRFSMGLAEGQTLEYNIETMKYSEPNAEHPSPITLDAASKVGRFPATLAQGVSEYLLLVAQMRQRARAIHKMAADGVLEERRLVARGAEIKELLDRIISAAELIGAEVKKAYPTR